MAVDTLAPVLTKPTVAPVTTPATTLAPALRPGVDDATIPAQLRQGDVLLYSVSTIPATAARMAPSATGYALMPAKVANAQGSHRIGKDGNVIAYAGKDGQVAYLQVTGFVSLDHHEHQNLLVPPGTWQVLRQREHVASALDVMPTVRAVAD